MKSIKKEIESYGFAVRESSSIDLIEHEDLSVSKEDVKYRLSRIFNTDIEDIHEITYSGGTLLLKERQMKPSYEGLTFVEYKEDERNSQCVYSILFEKQLEIYIIQGEKSNNIDIAPIQDLITIDEDTYDIPWLDNLLGEGEILSEDEASILIDIINTMKENDGDTIVERSRVSPLLLRIIQNKYTIDEDISYVVYSRSIECTPNAMIRESMYVRSSDEDIDIDIDEFAIGILITKGGVELLDISHEPEYIEITYAKDVETYIVSI